MVFLSNSEKYLNSFVIIGGTQLPLPFVILQYVLAKYIKDFLHLSISVHSSCRSLIIKENPNFKLFTFFKTMINTKNINNSMKLNMVLEVLQRTSEVDLKLEDNAYVGVKQIGSDLVKVKLSFAGTNLIYVDFNVNGSFTVDGKKSLGTAIQTFEFVISCINTMHQRFSTAEFYFGADEEHEKLYDKLLPRFKSRFNFTFSKDPFELSKSERFNKAVNPLFDKKYHTMTAVYYLKINDGWRPRNTSIVTNQNEQPDLNSKSDNNRPEPNALA
jgi:hypothetical protein